MIDAARPDLHIADPTTRLGPPPGRGAIWTSAPFLLIAAVCAAMAFAGLGVSSYWIDELFTLYVVDHQGGYAEVLRRALTDTHPPAFYFLFYSWTQAFGTSEVGTHLFSALLAVCALGVFFFGMSGSFSLPARAFALALAAGSKAFYDNSQFTRSYAFCILLAAVLLALGLAIHRRLARGLPLPPRLMGAVWAVSLLGAFSHFYLLLVAGGVHLFLLLSVRSWRERIIVVVSGLSIVALISGYVVSLVHHTEQPLGEMWFNNSPSLLGRQAISAVGKAFSGLTAVGLLILALQPLRERLAVADRITLRPQHVPLAPLAMIWSVTLVTVGTGLFISIVFVPSFGQRNLLVLMPFWWMLGAWLYERAAPDPRQWVGRGLLALLVVALAINMFQLKGRFLPRQEEWRVSASYVNGLDACRGQEIPVVLPWIFGPPTPFFRNLAQVYFFGRYDQQPSRLTVLSPEEFSPRGASPALRALYGQRLAGGCPVLAWGVHDLKPDRVEALRENIAATAGVPLEKVRVRVFNRYAVKLLGKVKARPSAWVFEVAR